MSLVKAQGVIVVHKGTECDLYVGVYDQGGGTALQLVERDTQEPWAKATVNIPEMSHLLGPDEVFIKDWSENEGMVDALVAAGVARRTGRFVTAGYVRATIVSLAPAPAPPAETPEGP